MTGDRDSTDSILLGLNQSFRFFEKVYVESYAEGTEKLACNQTDIDTGCEEKSQKEDLGKH